MLYRLTCWHVNQWDQCIHLMLQKKNRDVIFSSSPTKSLQVDEKETGGHPPHASCTSFWTPVKSLGPVVFDVLTSIFLKQSQRKLANEKQIDILDPSICAFSLFCRIFYRLQWASKYCFICFQKCLKFLTLSINTQCKPLSSLAVPHGKGRLNWPVIKQYPPLNSPAGGFSQCLMKLIDRSSQSCSL